MRRQKRSQKFSFRHKLEKFTIWFVLPPGYPFFAYALSLSLWCYATPFLFFSLFTLDATTYLLFQRLREWGNKRWHFITNLRIEEGKQLFLLRRLGSISRDLIHRKDNFLKVLLFNLLLSNFWSSSERRNFLVNNLTCCTYLPLEAIKT